MAVTPPKKEEIDCVQRDADEQEMNEMKSNIGEGATDDSNDKLMTADASVI
jgi:hypothetical protein